MRATLISTLVAAATLLGTTAQASAPGDARIARGSVATLSDLPSGWAQHSPGRSQVTCKAFVAARARASAIAKSKAFTLGETTQAATAVYVYAAKAAASRAFKAMSGREGLRCYAGQVAKVLSATGDIKVRRVKTARLSMERIGDQRATERVSAVITSDGTELDLYVDLVYVRTGRGLSLGVFINVATPFDEALRRQLTTTQVGRLSDMLEA